MRTTKKEEEEDQKTAGRSCEPAITCSCETLNACHTLLSCAIDDGLRQQVPTNRAECGPIIVYFDPRARTRTGEFIYTAGVRLPYVRAEGKTRCTPADNKRIFDVSRDEIATGAQRSALSGLGGIPRLDTRALAGVYRRTAGE